MCQYIAQYRYELNQIFISKLRTPNAGLQTPDAGLQTPDAELQTPDARPLADTSHSDAGRQTPDAANFGASEPRNFNSIRGQYVNICMDTLQCQLECPF